MRTTRPLNVRLRPVLAAALAAVAAVALTACSSGGDSAENPTTVTLVTHESFNVGKETLAAFTRQTGLTVKVLRSGDAGTATNQAILTRGNPQGDVFFGVDNTFLSRALDAGLFTPYAPAGLDGVPAEFRLDPQRRATPVDYGDVCVNYDRKYFADRRLTPPQTFADLAKPAYKDLLVVQNPATSSPGLAFLLGTVDTFGPDGWQGYWKQLKANGALVVDGWEEAYQQRFTVGSKGKGNRPLVVSYASSPPAEVVFAGKPAAVAPSGVSTGTCFRQVEFAGLLAGAKNPTGGKKLLDFLLSATFQRDVPLQMFVFPVVKDVPLPEAFTKHAVVPTDPATLPAEEIAKNRDAWIKSWQGIVLR